ncbi:hypothetical protein D2E26_0714 [Bifidobacterium dolichotidis]|uniref:Uncharacterized protein n=1 Tax=Bifidobacterium dolichotidis TaxID=2306976 RepID=A0A430FTG3_9BIFI|nr:hypothetical protein [Bifidobacterium dolichotidis]RSX56151.1 hypothetical protein D2E26_0714 [Bifidobacterium dolichotidis]
MHHHRLYDPFSPSTTTWFPGFVVVVCLVAIAISISALLRSRKNEEHEKHIRSAYITINLGMSYHDVAQILGSEGMLQSEDALQKQYIWYVGARSPRRHTAPMNIVHRTAPAYIRCTFEYDKLIRKEQCGL